MAFLVVEQPSEHMGFSVAALGPLEPRLNSCGELSVVAPQYGDLRDKRSGTWALALAGGFLATGATREAFTCFLNSASPACMDA